MGKPLVSTNGRYQWNAMVRGHNGEGWEIKHITVFCNERAEAAREAVAEIEKCGYAFCTLNHITKIGNRQC